MGRKLNYLWRLCATALCFAFFGLGGALMALLCFPVLRLCTPKAQRHARIQRLLHRSYRLFLGVLQLMGICTIRLEGAEKLQHGTHLLVANHPSLLDVVLILSAVPEADCIVKAGAWRNPFLRGVVGSAGYIRNQEDPAELIQTCVSRLQAGRSLLIFPEGTRSLPGQLQPLKRGAATIALRSGMPLTPITLTCTPTTLTKAEKWYNIPERPFELAMKVGEPIDVQPVLDDSKNHLIAARKLTQRLKDYFLKTGSYHG